VPAAVEAGQPHQRRELHLPLPNNKFGRLLGKRVNIVPNYFKEAWRELRLVVWPNRRETLKLSLAVFIFAAIFGGLIWVVDYGLDRLFREVLLDLN
jgi:preprotein translocase SecE subunit